MGRSVTMQAVAKRAGVSTKTVSNVLNGTGSFSPDTEQRVREAVAELSYRVNPFARGLRSRRTETIALAVPNLYQPFYAELAEQIIRAPETQGLKVLLESTRGEAERERAVLAGSRRDLVDGVIYVPHALTAEQRQDLPIAQPTVILGDHPPDGASPAEPYVDYIEIADEGGAHAAVSHLIAQGRGRIAAIGDRPDWPAGAHRLRGYRRALAEANLPFDESLVISVDNPDLWASGVNAATRLLRTRTRFDALFCFNDVLAVGARSVLARSGIAVPEQVAMAGFGNIEASRYASPPLTTVDPGTDSLARTALSLLRSRIDQDDFRNVPGRREIAGFTLHLRKSSNALSPAGPAQLK